MDSRRHAKFYLGQWEHQKQGRDSTAPEFNANLHRQNNYPPDIDDGLHVVQDLAPENVAYLQKHEQALVDEGLKPQGLAPAERRIYGLRRATFILTCAFALILVLYICIVGVFGSLITNQSAEIDHLREEAFERPSASTNLPQTTLTAPLATVTWVKVADWEFIGCWEDDSSRVFGDSDKEDTALTNRACANFCDDFEYFGTEFGTQCYCSKTPPKTVAPPWNCNSHCGGSDLTSEICGGFFFLSAWRRNNGTR
ncbi:hypothetical protein B0J13DRAFT_41692 [Dactylonectria estremocensis]|uniref:WSC domain-containing protein n=1 Tax=Dactylonectria estremocensis TaxID=1079267 RepID=A0A9P9ETF5_9HYPO|nr:hypothetical protein B0J13DRAFT_41692 [Dactylonectria estremocensis]